MNRILLEIVASTAEDCVAAETGGADRVELCAAIDVGGLTPPLETLVEAKRRVKIPIMAMVRPRGGDFCYSAEEFALMFGDADRLLGCGANGIAFGILLPDGSVDSDRCALLRELGKGVQTVFHRAFDVVPDPIRSLQHLIELRFTRILTSGQRSSALEGSGLIRNLIELARDRIEVLPGGKVRAHNARLLVDTIGCSQLHMTACYRSNGYEDLSKYRVDPHIVAEMRQVLDEIARDKLGCS